VLSYFNFYFDFCHTVAYLKRPASNNINLCVVLNQIELSIFHQKCKKMQNKKSFNTSKVPRMTEVFPQAVIADNLVFLSGITSVDPTTGQLPDNFEKQAIQALANIKTILEELGSSLDKILKTTVFMVTGNDFGVLNKVYSQVFPENAPARSTPQVMPFPGGILISIECIALL
jgi:2-iminobutanoate/2-iminopropanoate deaminase